MNAMLSPVDVNLEAFEALLREQRDVLLKDLRGLELDTAGGGEEGVSNHLADRGTDSAELDISLDRSGSTSAEIHEIDEALARLHNGTFGACEDCGKPIPIERLHAIPFARQCIPCKMAEEGA